MWTHHVERLVPSEPSAVHTAIETLINELWGGRHRTLLDTADERIDAILAGAGSNVADVWLTWKVGAHTDGTWVEATLDEVEAGPTPDLATLLEVLAQRTRTQPSADA
jgi:putative intracellular protease/amidase